MLAGASGYLGSPVNVLDKQLISAAKRALKLRWHLTLLFNLNQSRGGAEAVPL